MKISGEIKIHKKIQTRVAAAVSLTENGDLLVWDYLPDDWSWKDNMVSVYVGDEYVDKNWEEVEPDIIASNEEWTRIERKNHHWESTSPQALRDRAKRRDDVDEDEISEV